MKKTLIVLIVVLLIFSFVGCKSQEQKMMEQAMQEFEDMTGQEQYGDSDSIQDWEDDMDPNDDGFDEDYQNEQAGVDDGDGNGEVVMDDGENSIQIGSGEWPEDAPDVIEEPKFGEAEITGIIASATGTVISYVDVGRTEAAELIASYLENSEWTMLAHTNDSDREVYTGQNADEVLTIDWDNGEFSILWETF